jgi:RNA polymerase sigma factor (sigma-70 family)
MAIFLANLKYRVSPFVYPGKMKATLGISTVMAAGQKEQIGLTVQQERRRLLDFIRRRIPDEAEAEDILQDVFFSFTESFMIQPIEQVSAWLFRAARNRITDMFRKKKAIPFSRTFKPSDDDDDSFSIQDLLPDPADGPEAIYARKIIVAELMEALEELPAEQRDAFVMNELDDMSFKTMSELTGEPVNTLISRKRYAVLYLRERLQDLYTEFLNR